MPRFRVLTPEASPTHFFGSEVRRAREEAGMTQSELGDLVPCDKATVSRIEAALIPPDAAFARACDAAFPHLSGFFTRFLNDSCGWTSAVAPSFRPFTEDEAQASSLLIFEHSVIPGLLQTPEYARSLLATYPGVSNDEVESRVAGRLTRQAILDQEDPPALWAVVDEFMLHRELGGPQVHATQLKHLSDMVNRPNITVQVLTARGHVGLQGAVNIAEKIGAPSIAYTEDFADGRLTDDPAAVAALTEQFRHLQSESLSATASRDLIGRLAERLCSQDGGSVPTAAARAVTA